MRKGVQPSCTIEISLSSVRYILPVNLRVKNFSTIYYGYCNHTICYGKIKFYQKKISWVSVILGLLLIII